MAWKEFKHPDFKDKLVEIGGFAPSAKSNPPEAVLESLARKEAQFLTELAGKLPRVGLRRVKIKDLGHDVFDITVEVENTGYLPTSLAQGALNREVLQTRIILDTDDANILTGLKRTLLGPIAGSGGMNEARYVIHAKGQREVHLEVISALGGAVETNIKLQESQ